MPIGFQHFPRDLADVNEWKFMFDPSSDRDIVKVNLVARILALS